MAHDTPFNPVSRRGVLVSAAAALAGATAARAAPGAGGGSARTRFDPERFVEDCIAASREGDAQAAVSEALARAVRELGAVRDALGDPGEAGLNVLLRSAELTIFAATWTPQMNLVPHDHRMWASIGIYTGREDNIFWRRTSDGIEAYGADALFEGDVAKLPPNAIHSVTNPLLRFTGGLHIYGGDFFDTPRSQWNAETLAEEPSDGAIIRAAFERENERFRRRGDL